MNAHAAGGRAKKRAGDFASNAARKALICAMERVKVFMICFFKRVQPDGAVEKEKPGDYWSPGMRGGYETSSAIRAAS